MMGYLLDTNIVTAVLKNNRQVINQYRSVRQYSQKICVSCITYYEIKRGLLYLDAAQRLSKFETFCSSVELLWMNSLELIETAATIHADLRRRGRPIQDADILIAATAIAHDLTLVSNDTDLLNIPTLTLENWLIEP